MTSDHRYHRMDVARVRAELTVQDLWLRYLALGGTHDAFDLDGYLQGLVALDPFQVTVLAHTLNEALDDSYETYRLSLAAPPAATGADDERMRKLIRQLLDEPAGANRTDGPTHSGGDPPTERRDG